MVVLYVILGILLILFILLLFPLWLKISFESEKEPQGKAGFLFISFPFFGKEKKEEESREKKASPANVKKEKAKKKEKKDFSEIIDIIKIIVLEVLKLSSRIKVAEIYLSLNIAKEDAAETAISYGRYNALVFGFISFLKNLFKFKKEKIEINPDFSGGETTYKVDLKLKLTGIFLLISAVRILKEVLLSGTNKRKEEEENASD